MSAKVPVTRPGGRTADVRRRIFQATTALLVEGGVPAVTFQAVAARASVGRATLYRRWTEPLTLIVDAIREAASESIAIPDTGCLEEDLRRVLQRIARFIRSPIGRAALIAGLSTKQDRANISMEQSYWAIRWTDVVSIFERAAKRGDIAANGDYEMRFAQAAGAIYFRAIVMNLPVDSDWILRAVRDALGNRRGR